MLVLDRGGGRGLRELVFEHFLLHIHALTCEVGVEIRGCG